MANPTGFLQYPRVEVGHRPVDERIQDWHEIDRPLVERVLNRAGRALHGLRHPLLPRASAAR